MLQELTKQLMAGQPLTADQAEAGLETIFANGIPDAAIGSFLTALSIKGETAAEIAGFARAMRRHAVPIASRHKRIVDTAGTGGGRETFNISTAAAFVIAAAGLPVAKHGNRAVTSRSGSADVLEALGARIDMSPETAARCLDELGFTFLFAPLYHPAMKRVAAIRRELGHRTVFNLIGPLTNPAGATHQVVGAFSPALTRTLAEALGLLESRRAWVVHSEDGLDELSVSRPTRIVETGVDGLSLKWLDPQSFGIAPAAESTLSAGSPEASAELVRRVLSGAERGPARDVVLLNAAAALHVADEGDFSDCLARSATVIDSGAAISLLNRFVEASHA
jgi:anthranilate phosphoribosyltransferase